MDAHPAKSKDIFLRTYPSEELLNYTITAFCSFTTKNHIRWQEAVTNKLNACTSAYIHRETVHINLLRVYHDLRLLRSSP